MRTKLEEFSEKVTSVALGVSSDTLRNDIHGIIDISTITAIIELVGQVIAMIQNCKQKSLVASVISPAWLEKIQFRLVVRSVFSDHPNPQVRKLVGKVTDAFFSETQKMKKEEVEAIVNETEAMNNWLI